MTKPLDEHRLCEGCNVFKPINKFPHRYGQRGPRRSVCRKCEQRAKARRMEAIEVDTPAQPAEPEVDAPDAPTAIARPKGSTPEEWEQWLAGVMAEYPDPPPDCVADLALQWAHDGEMRAALLLIGDWRHIERWLVEQGVQA